MSMQLNTRYRLNIVYNFRYNSSIEGQKKKNQRKKSKKRSQDRRKSESEAEDDVLTSIPVIFSMKVHIFKKNTPI